LTKYQPQTPAPPEVEIDGLDDRIPTDEEAEKALRAMGFVDMPKETLAHFRTIGVHFKGRGVLKTQRGSAFIGQQRLHQAMAYLSAYLVEQPSANGKKPKRLKVKDAVEVTKALALAVGKMTDSHKFVVSLEAKSKADGLPLDEAPTAKSFPPGTVMIGGNAQAHFHAATPPKVPEPPTDEKVVANPPVAS